MAGSAPKRSIAIGRKCRMRKHGKKHEFVGVLNAPCFTSRTEAFPASVPRGGRLCQPRGPLLAPKTPPFVMWGGRVGVDWRGKTGTVVGPTHNFGPKESTVQWRKKVPALVAP